MRIGTHRRGRRRAGAAAVELAFLAPVLTYIAMITSDYPRLFFAQATLSDSARAGAMYYATHFSTATSATIQQVALADAGNLSPTPTVSSATWVDSSSNTYVQVTVSYTFKTTFVNPTIPSSTALSQSVVMLANP